MTQLGFFKIFEQSSLRGLNFVIRDDGLVSQVRCMICTSTEGNEKLLSLKLDTLKKHVGQKKIVVFMGAIIKEWFFN
jgi:hypothetical protein